MRPPGLTAPRTLRVMAHVIDYIEFAVDVEAAFAAFEQYSKTVETQNQAMIEGLATYCLTPKGGVITAQQMAPLLALNVLA